MLLLEMRWSVVGSEVVWRRLRSYIEVRGAGSRVSMLAAVTESGGLFLRLSP